MATPLLRRRRASCVVAVHLALLLIGWAMLTLFQEIGTRDSTLGLYTHNHLHLSAPLFQAVHLIALACLLFCASWVRCGWIVPLGTIGMILGAVILSRPDHSLFPGLLLGGLPGFLIGTLIDISQSTSQRQD